MPLRMVRELAQDAGIHRHVLVGSRRYFGATLEGVEQHRFEKLRGICHGFALFCGECVGACGGRRNRLDVDVSCNCGREGGY